VTKSSGTIAAGGSRPAGLGTGTGPSGSASNMAGGLRAAPSALRILFMETQMEFFRLLRSPSFAVPVITFPLMFYVLFAVVLGPPSAHNGALARHLLATYSVFGVMAPGLFGLGVTLAMDRERGLLELKRALPMPGGAYLGAKVIMTAAFAAIVSLALMLLSATVGQVVLAAAQWCKLFVVSVMGVLPFCSLGLFIGTLTKGQAAPAVINLVYLPMSFLSGLLLPMSVMPHFIQQIAPIWPSWHLAQLTLDVVDNDDTQAVSLAAHILTVIGEGVLFFALARRRLSKLR
jgi:ABC-2 type transport system permease protein